MYTNYYNISSNFYQCDYIIRACSTSPLQEHEELGSKVYRLEEENTNLRMENRLLREQLNWGDDHDWVDEKSWYKSRIEVLQQENEALRAENVVLKTKIASLENEVHGLKNGVS
jgi:regulator of replication initiation timing